MLKCTFAIANLLTVSFFIHTFFYFFIFLDFLTGSILITIYNILKYLYCIKIAYNNNNSNNKTTKFFVISSSTFTKHFHIFLIILKVFQSTHLGAIQSILPTFASVCETFGNTTAYAQMTNGFWSWYQRRQDRFKHLIFMLK